MTTSEPVPGDAPQVDSLTLDARAVQVLAHPLRSRLLSALRLDGAATATTLAEALDTNSGATSYHLRKLAEVGLVVDTGEGRGRERVWRAATQMHNWTDTAFEGDADASAAVAWLRGHYLRSFVAGAESWLAHQDAWPLAWRDAAGSDDYIFDMSPERLARMLVEIRGIFNRYRVAAPGSPDGEPTDEGATVRVATVLFAYPLHPEASPE